MVASVVIAVITAAVVVGVGNIRGAAVSSEAGRLSVATRYLFNLAVLNGTNYRLVIDLSEHSWWGEAQTTRDPCKAFMIEDPDAEPAQEDDDDEDGDAKTKAAAFEKTKGRLLKKRKLDKGARFGGVMTTRMGSLAEEGQVAVNFFPDGTVDSALIYVTDGDPDGEVMTVEILGLQGLARVRPGELPIDEFLAGEGS
jgi:hypothetical protein